MKERFITSFDQVMLKVVHSDLDSDRENLVIVLPLATKASLIRLAIDSLRGRYNIITWESRLILDPTILIRQPEALSIESSVRDLDAILAHFELETILLVGYCSGAATALHIASKRERHIHKMALINGAYFIRRPECERTQYEKDILDLAPVMASSSDQAIDLLKQFLGSGPKQVEDGDFAQEFLRPYQDNESLHRFGIGLCNLMDSDLGSIAQKIGIPTLVAAGKCDSQTHYSSSILISSKLAKSESYIDYSGDHYEFCRAKPALIERIVSFFTAGGGACHAC